MVENPKGEGEKEKVPKKTTVVSCIDFRSIKKQKRLLEEQGLKDGDYYLLSTAGAALNPVTRNILTNVPIDLLIVCNHKDCGYAKKTGSDDDGRHHQSMQELGAAVAENNFQTNLIPIEGADLQRHHCSAVAIILGKPEIVKRARTELESQNLEDDHDEIARPVSLVDDESVWEDLKISLALHQPKRILIFEEDENNAKILFEKAKAVAEGIRIVPEVIPLAA